MELSNKNLNHLENIPKFNDLDVETKTVVIKHFFDFKSNFLVIIEEETEYLNAQVETSEYRTITCRPCLNAVLVNQSTKGMIEHHLVHTLDNLTKLGLYNKRPIELYLGG